MSIENDHDEMFERMSSIFKDARLQTMKDKGVEKEDLRFVSYQIEGTEVTLVDSSLVHIDIEGGKTVSLLEDIDAREYKIYLHENEEDEPTLVSKMNISDDPSTKVYVGRTNLEAITVLNSIDNGIKSIEKLESKVEAKPQKPKHRGSHRPRR